MDKIKDSVHKRKNKIFAFFSFSIILLMLILVFWGLAIQIVDHIATQTYTWKASEYYPLKKESAKLNEPSVIERISNKIAAVENKIEQKVTSSFYFKMPFVLIKKTCDKLMGLDMTTSLCSGENDLKTAEDIVLEYEDDYLGFVMDDIDISEKIEKLITFGNQMESEGRDFLFFMTPEKYKGNAVYGDHSGAKTEEVLNAFSENSLDIICLQEMMDKSDMAALFFKTDHHWLPSTGIWADGVLCETLNEKYGYNFNVSIFNIDNYRIDILEESFLGSQGKKVTEVYCQKEDFPIVTPKYNTDLQVFISRKGTVCYGDIENTLLDYSVFDEKDSYVGSKYNFYGYGSQELVTIHNNGIHDGSNILLIKTSFANCMYPYLAAVVEDLYVVDLRHFSGSLQTYIKEIDPDTVIVIYGMTAFETGKEGKAFDFR